MLDVPEDTARRLYETKLALVRPDQHVAWRGDQTPDDARALIDRARGEGAVPEEIPTEVHA